jgi:copper transport protein
MDMGHRFTLKVRQYSAQLFIQIGLILLALAVPDVWAHAELVEAEPEPGAQLADSPAEIRLTFSEPIGTQSDIVVLGEGFAPIEGIEPQLNTLSTSRPQQIYTALPPLEPGTYTVQWSAVSEDGHEISGSYSFSIGQVSETDSTAAQTSAQQTPTTTIIWWFFALLTVALVIAFILFRYGRTGRRI